MMLDDEHLPVPVPVAPPVAVDSPESSMLVEFGGKRLQGELRRVRGGRLRYALSVVNDAPLYLLLSFRVRRGAAEHAVAPGELWMDPQSTADLNLDVPAIDGFLGGRVIVRLVNARVRHELVAPLPGPRLWLGALAGALLTGAIAFGVSFAHPHVDLFAVPPLGVAGSTLQVPYQSGGVGALGYALDDDRGATVTSGTLQAASGTLALPLPNADHTRNYVVRLVQRGPLGTAERVEPVTALPAPAPPQSQLIESLSLETPQVQDGGAIAVRYRTSASSGRVEVRDAQNTLWAQTPIARNGISEISLPHFGKDKELRVTLSVERNGQRESSSVGLNVTGAAAAPSEAGGSNEPGSALVASDAAVGNDGMIRVAIEPGARNVRLALETTDGATLASQSVPDGATSAAIAVPRKAHGRIVLVTTYDRGSGEESTVKPVDVP